MPPASPSAAGAQAHEVPTSSELIVCALRLLKGARTFHPEHDNVLRRQLPRRNLRRPPTSVQMRTPPRARCHQRVTPAPPRPTQSPPSWARPCAPAVHPSVTDATNAQQAAHTPCTHTQPRTSAVAPTARHRRRSSNFESTCAQKCQCHAAPRARRSAATPPQYVTQHTL